MPSILISHGLAGLFDGHAGLQPPEGKAAAPQGLRQAERRR
jgi:hypothetical protein